MRINLRLVLVCVFLAGAVGEVRAQAGTFARMGFGARGVAMSNALVADASGQASPYYNPALTPFIEEQSLEATTAFLTLDRELQFLQFVAPLRPRAGVAMGLIHAGVSDIDGRDASGYHTQDYSWDEYGFFLSFGTRIGERLTGGFSLQLFQARVLADMNPAQSVGLDLGLSLRASERLHLGFVVDDLLAQYSWDTSEIVAGGGQSTEPFPRRLRLGAAYVLSGGRARVLAEYESRIASSLVSSRETEFFDGTPAERRSEERLRLHSGRLRIGSEYRPAEAFAVRAGVDRIGVGGLKPSAGFMVEQSIGNLRTRAEYSVVLEPYAAAPMHFVSLRLYL